MQPPAGAQYVVSGASVSVPLVGSTAGGEMDADGDRDGEVEAETVRDGEVEAETVRDGVTVALALAVTRALGEALALSEEDQPGLTVGDGDAVTDGEGTQAVSVTEPALPP